MLISYRNLICHNEHTEHHANRLEGFQLSPRLQLYHHTTIKKKKKVTLTKPDMKLTLMDYLLYLKHVLNLCYLILILL